MLNLDMGTARDVAGRSCIETARGRRGFAVYGPYDLLPAGDYLVEFVLGPAGVPDAARDERCAVLDVTTDVGSTQLARKELFLSQLDGRGAFSLRFSLAEPTRVEFRVWVSGVVPLVVEAYRRVVPIDSREDGQQRLDATRFPGDEGEASAFFREHRGMLRELYEQGIGIAIRHGRVVATFGAVSLYVDSPDDLNFVGEVFHENVYNIRTTRETVVFDVGMNIGLASLMFAAKAEVAQVYAFEPFRNTFDRASDNVALNPPLAAKIRAFNHGLSDADIDDVVEVGPAGDSGSASTVMVAGGRSVHLSLRDAGSFLAPLVAEARSAGRDVVVKIDCEGSEFAVFRSLAAHGLLPQIRAVMVEWHAMFEGRSQDELIAPLLAQGFVVFDRSPPRGNGFFYAVRVGA